MLTGGTGNESGVLLLSGEMWIKRNSLPQRVSSTHTLTQCHNSIYLIDTKVRKHLKSFSEFAFYSTKNVNLPLQV